MKIDAKRTLKSPLGILFMSIKKSPWKVFKVAGALASIASGFAQTTTSSSGSATATVSLAVPACPKIQFSETTFDFGKINSGEVVKHDFVFTNIGTAVLKIQDVRVGCGCTAVGTWDRQVEPGKTGVIPLQFNSGSFSGTVRKSATVTCSDPGQSNVVLHLKSTVWKPIDVTPSMAVFHLSSELQTNEVRVVRIVSNLEEPLELSDLQCTNRSFQAELKTVRPGKEFELRITAVPPFISSPVMAPVTLKTSSSNHPTLRVSAYVTVQQPVTVEPNLIMLPQGPLTNAMQRVLTIRNKGTNALVLSEPRVTVTGPEARVEERQQGLLFTLTVDFPVGFQAQLGQDVEVTVKSNHPKFPLIKVAVLQLQPGAGPLQPQPLGADAATQGPVSPPRVVPSGNALPAAAGK